MAYDSTVPFTRSSPITPSDTVNLTENARSLYITTGGTLHFLTVDDYEDTITVPNHFILPGQIKRIYVTGTTATGIHSWV